MPGQPCSGQGQLCCATGGEGSRGHLLRQVGLLTYRYCSCIYRSQFWSYHSSAEICQFSSWKSLLQIFWPELMFISLLIPKPLLQHFFSFDNPLIASFPSLSLAHLSSYVQEQISWNMYISCLLPIAIWFFTLTLNFKHTEEKGKRFVYLAFVSVLVSKQKFITSPNYTFYTHYTKCFNSIWQNTISQWRDLPDKYSQVQICEQ